MWSRFEGEVWPRLWRWSSVKTLRLEFGRDLKVKILRLNWEYWSTCDMAQKQLLWWEQLTLGSVVHLAMFLSVSQFIPSNGGNGKAVNYGLERKLGDVTEFEKDDCCVACQLANYKFTNFGHWVIIFNFLISGSHLVVEIQTVLFYLLFKEWIHNICRKYRKNLSIWERGKNLSIRERGK